MIGMITEVVVVTPLFGVDKEKKTVDFVGEESSKITFTSFPEYVELSLMSSSITNVFSVARFLVASLLKTGPGERELRVQGETVTAKDLFSTLSKVQNIPYEVGYTPLAKAREIEGNFEKEGNAVMAGLMNLKHAVGARGWLDGNDDGQFDFKPETVEETFKRV